MNEHNSLL